MPSSTNSSRRFDARIGLPSFPSPARRAEDNSPALQCWVRVCDVPSPGRDDRNVLSIFGKVRAVGTVQVASQPSNTIGNCGDRSRRLVHFSAASHGRTPEGFTVNSRGWSEARATPPDARHSAPEPRRGSPGTGSSAARGMGPPRRGGRHCGCPFRGCARASRTPGYLGTTPPGLGCRIAAPIFAMADTHASVVADGTFRFPDRTPSTQVLGYFRSSLRDRANTRRSLQKCWKRPPAQNFEP